MSLKSNKYKPAFTMVEVLVALAISALLLAAVAFAFNASAVNYEENKNISTTLNTGRQAMLRMTTELRCATAVNPATPSNKCTFINSNGQDITYNYQSSEKKLYLTTTDGVFIRNSLLCENVNDMNFTLQTATKDGLTYVKAVLISMTLQSEDFEQKISSAAVIRKNLE